MVTRKNPLVIKCILNFYLIFNKFEEDETFYLTKPLEI
jgi:hypothetical protein